MTATKIFSFRSVHFFGNIKRIVIYFLMKGSNMKDTLKAGLEYEFKFTVPENKTVPHLYPEASEFQEMPQVLATGFLVGLIEWTCIQAVKVHIDWPKEQTVGIQIRMAHTAATPPGFTVTVKTRLVQIDGKRLTFEFSASDGVDEICKGTHERFIINAEKFAGKLEEKKSYGQ
jgi:fluoroacetyl-CoA thioesterase